LIDEDIYPVDRYTQDGKLSRRTSLSQEELATSASAVVVDHFVRPDLWGATSDIWDDILDPTGPVNCRLSAANKSNAIESG
jgi:hypothetical protein